MTIHTLQAVIMQVNRIHTNSQNIQFCEFFNMKLFLEIPTRKIFLNIKAAEDI